jgi:hypothetical protein
MRVYLAGPMTGFPEWNFPAFHDAALTLRLRGYRVWSPAERDIANGFDPKSDGSGFDLAGALRDDVAAVLDSDAVVVLPGFEESAGAMVEVLTAESAGIPWMTFDEALTVLSGRVRRYPRWAS